WRTIVIDIVDVGRNADRIDDERIAIFVTADRFAEPQRLYVLRMFVGEENAAHHLIALPDHPYLLGLLDEIERLRRIEQLPWDAARIAPRLRRKRKVAFACEQFFIRFPYLLGRPGLEYRVFVI